MIDLLDNWEELSPEQRELLLLLLEEQGVDVDDVRHRSAGSRARAAAEGAAVDGHGSREPARLALVRPGDQCAGRGVSQPDATRHGSQSDRRDDPCRQTGHAHLPLR